MSMIIKPKDMKEPNTGIVFPATLSPDGEELTLGTVGVRKRFLFSVYAFGIYFHESNAREELNRWDTYDMDELRTNLSFYNAIISSQFSKAVRMVLHRAVNGNDLRIAFEESLGPRVRHFGEIYSKGHNKVNARKIQTNGLVALKDFQEQFAGGKMPKGTEIIIKNTGHTLVTYINQQQLKSIECHSLCSAFFDVFLGAQPISNPSKDLFAMRISLLIVPPNKLTEHKIRRALQARL